MTLNQKKILELFKIKNTLTPTQIREVTSIAKTTVTDSLNTLVKLNKIAKYSQGRATYYELIEQSITEKKKITVFEEGIKIGTLEYGEGKHYFNYDKKYKGKELSGLKKNKENVSTNLFPVFENLIPEYKRREKVYDPNKGEILTDSLVNLNNTHGAYDFFYTYEDKKFSKDYTSRKSWISAKNKILGIHDYPNILNMKLLIDDDILNAKTSGEHSHMSGNQNKVDISIDFKKNEISENLENAEYMLKPYNDDIANYFNQFKNRTKTYYPYISINEHLFMSFAKIELNFDVPFSALIKAEKEFHYITKRYDRYENFKYEQNDFAQYLKIRSENKYKPTSETLFEKINEVLYSEESKLDALKFYYYSSIIKHSDLHVKNIGALNIGKEKKVLTPLYDVISIAVYQDNCDDLALSMSYKRKNQRKKFKVEDFYGLADIIGIKREVFRNEAKKILDTFLTKFPDYIEKTKKLLEYDDLKINSTRHGNGSFIQKLNHFYYHRLITFRKLGTLKYLDLEFHAEKLKNRKKYDKKTHELIDAQE